ncbi:protein kinase [Streptomyces sp. L2]|uniref:protein kinase n=1 Tax=Streptomyces sp. L2 TaxID=2162665 RepID=UPI00101098E6|nr:protein kinase [Streptomyces sp. L2]
MEDYAGRVLADRYRLPLPPADEYELTETRAFDTYSGQEVLVRQVPLPEVVEAEVLDAEGLPEGFTPRQRGARPGPAGRTATRQPADPAVRRAVEAVQAAARIPDHPRLDQVFDVFAEGGSLWVVSELVAARPLAALLAEQPLSPYRAAEVASDVLMALRVLHGHGWVHRNITARTVLVCDDGRVMLTGLAVGAAEEALCGYDPVPPEEGGAPGAGGAAGHGEFGGYGTSGAPPATGRGSTAPGQAPSGTAALYPSPSGTAVPSPAAALGSGRPGGGASAGPGAGPGAGRAVPQGESDPEAARRAAIQARGVGGLPVPGASGTSGGAPSAGGAGAPGRSTTDSVEDIRAARAGAIAAYRAGARAAARVQEAQQNTRAALPAARPSTEDDDTGAERTNGAVQQLYPPGAGWADGTEQRPYPAGAGPTGGGQRAYPADAERTNGAVRQPYPSGGAQQSYPSGVRRADGLAPESYAAGAVPGPPGRIADPYGVQGAPWHGASPRTGPGGPDPVQPVQAAARPGGSAPALPAQSKAPVPPAELTPASPRPGFPASASQRGPATALAAERARQVRMTVVGPVTERWAPEQAGSVHENWQLAAPIGPATDLWALGALLFRAVQGHAPYPEESTAELVQLVCAEPPAFAEECGPLRPVVESLLRQDPTERPEFEELRGWLRSLVRSAPEPDAGAHVVPVPPADPSRLPIVRRRGELVRRRRAGLPAAGPHGRHKRARQDAGSPHHLGRTLLLVVLLLLAGAVAYALLFMPKDDSDGNGDRTGSAGQVSPAPTAPAQQETPSPTGHGTPAPSTETQTQGDSSVADGFTLRTDPEGFKVAVAKGWDRTPKNGSGEVVYAHAGFELLVVPGRDSAAQYGGDPMAYQRNKERELRPYRDSSWATATGLRTIEVGGRTMAEGQFTWTDDQGHDLFVRNMAILLDGRYHIVQVRGPEAERDEVTRLYEQATATYRYTR